MIWYAMPADPVDPSRETCTASGAVGPPPEICQFIRKSMLIVRSRDRPVGLARRRVHNPAPWTEIMRQASFPKFHKHSSNLLLHQSTGRDRMYPDKKFIVEELDEIRAFVEKHPFATLVATDSSGEYVATHVPLLVEQWGEKIIFRGHMMRETDHWEALKHRPHVFVSFLGPDAPVLGSWQLTPRFGGTWNYQAVHVRGIAQSRDCDVLVKHLEELKNRFETSPDHKFSSLPSEYIDALLPLIECFDIVVSDLKCIFKLSQNRKIEEFDRTAGNLRLMGGKSALVAEEMLIRRAEFYPCRDT
ncbi:FMN-binding negative transcriptional regulator [Pseudoxanthomonas suwonensis]|uniref:FMN-binding negative transcriptional regulator n=1 Tax=Pseudoxanthomonas suwonensis TaxID=314722 RepID=UPI0009E335FF|nr:FMN-binding negative transcriptional regulator [Pseudoxanthomonas suwonensis]